MLLSQQSTMNHAKATQVPPVHGCGDARFSGLGGQYLSIFPTLPEGPAPADVPGFARISWVDLVEAGGQDPWTPWQVPSPVRPNVIYNANTYKAWKSIIFR